MYGRPPNVRPDGSGRAAVQQGQQQQSVHLNPNFYPNPSLLQNPCYQLHGNPFIQSLGNFPPIRQSIPFPRNGFSIPGNASANFQTLQPPANNDGTFPLQRSEVLHEIIGNMDKAVIKAHHDLLALNKYASAWEVSQMALLMVKAESWESLGIQMQQVPSLYRLLVTEGKINAFIHCFVAVRKVTSLHDLEVAICESEGIERFEELKLGPLVRNPLAVHYFFVPSELTEVYRIGTEEIISFLCEFIDTHKRKQVQLDRFLDFISRKQAVSGWEKLCIRIQNIEVYINHIKRTKSSEDAVLQKCMEKTCKKASGKNKKRPLFNAQKKQLDENFTSISQRIKSFSSQNTKYGGKHIRFTSSSSEVDVSEDTADDSQDEKTTKRKYNLLPPNARTDSHSSCPYPSATEEKMRLGLKNEVSCSPSSPADAVWCNAVNERLRRKRKSETISSNSLLHKLLKTDKVDLDFKQKDSGNLDVNGHLLSIESLKLFVTTWKEACRGNNVEEVFERMLESYKVRKRKKVKSLFTSFPFVGLLNTAVTCIKFGMWDNMYDSFQDFNDQCADIRPLESASDYINIDIETAKDDVAVLALKDLSHKHGVTAQDIVKKICGYFEDDILIFKNPCSENLFIILRKLCMCEQWLIEQYSVAKFETLGFGEYFTFLNNYMHLMPCLLQKFFVGDISKKDSLEACLLPLQLDVLLSQALDSLWDNKIADMQNISELLVMQFPLVCFQPLKSNVETVVDILQEKRKASSCLLFSSPLLRLNSMDYSLAQNEKSIPGTSLSDVNSGLREGMMGAVTTKDAVEVLLKAPMLTDLRFWSHWDRIYAPSLGSIVKWLLNEVNTKDLLCLVTRDAKIIRIDHSASTESLLDVFCKGSAFETAVQLLSLFALYGGERNVPLSLLKCHARHAFEVLLNKSLVTETSDVNSLMSGKPIVGHKNSTTIYLGSKLPDDMSNTDKAVSVMSRFILDCLSYLPIEFCCFAADILISGAQFFSKHVPSAILSECKQIEHRLLLHEVGMSLGLLEWVEDYHSFRSASTSGFFPLNRVKSEFDMRSLPVKGLLNRHSSSGEKLVSSEADHNYVNCNRVTSTANFDSDEVSSHSQNTGSVLGNCITTDPATVIDSIRREEFGVDHNLSAIENKMLEKQHARLGRALHCLSQELYSQDSHFLLELVQNADDNIYPENVEPTITFILLEKAIIVLNNEQGFLEKNIRALCDVGNSTKRGQNAGYIGKKGLGFKSVFRITDSPEIHSNGFHIKFDKGEGQIGFVLPTVISPCDIEVYTKLASTNTDRMDQNSWTTCIVLPIKLSILEGSTMNNILSMFSDLHPSLLLFLHQLRCIKFKNILDDSLAVMRKEILGDGIVEIALGNEKMTWFVVSQELQADVLHSDVQTTEISIAFTIQETHGEGYTPILSQQPVFAFLPLRTYGLKVILQGDFVLPSSREEVDGNSPWNQWLLSEFPDLFVSAERLFCDLPCYKEIPGKAVTTFMSFVPLVGEVHGFFYSLPRMIISKLRLSNCLLLDSDVEEWVPPCKVLRNWTVQARSLLPDSLINKHLGLGFLHKEIIISDSLARTLGVEDYGPKVLLDVITSLCRSVNGLELLGFSWLSSWINAVYVMLQSHSFMQTTSSFGTEPDFILSLQKIPFIPLLDGTFGSVQDGTIWLHSDLVSLGNTEEFILKSFTKLYAKLRTVSPNLLAAAASVKRSSSDSTELDNVARMLYKVGVQQLSAHEIVKVHILPVISDEKRSVEQEDLMVEYLSFTMFHLQSSCSTCSQERDQIMIELHEKAFILTNFGYRRLNEVPLHFGQEYGNPVDVDKLISGMDMKWHQIDAAYLKHPITKSIPDGELKWRNFLQALGITDFVKIVQVEKSPTDMFLVNAKDIVWDYGMLSKDSIAKNWESEELFQLLSCLSTSIDLEKSKYLLEILDRLWDNYFCDKVNGYYIDSTGQTKTFKSSLITILQDVPWIVSRTDNQRHCAKDLFNDCVAVNSLLGVNAPYAVPKVRSEKLEAHIGLKTQVSLDDVLSVFKYWVRIETPFKASVSQMSNLYTFICKAMLHSKEKIMEKLFSGPFIFVPDESCCSHDDIVPGSMLSPQDVCWSDLISSAHQINSVHTECATSRASYPLGKLLRNFYPNLHEFFVVECGVNENPPFSSYLQILMQLSTMALPHQAAKRVFEVFLLWSDALNSGTMCLEDVKYLKESLLRKDTTVLPSRQDKWVSLHSSFGVICWCDDDALGREFKHLDGIDFLYFGEYADKENMMHPEKISIIIERLGIPALSEIVTREAIYYGAADCSFIYSMLNWILPYAQRYVFNVHPDKYVQLKQTNFINLRQLKIVVVEELFYQNAIKSCKIVSKKRYGCDCLLQENILYCSRASDLHTIFMEFSRLLHNGTPDLHFANFLHMVTTMAESGATEEQTEIFILNSQKVPKLPVDEYCWTLPPDDSTVEMNPKMVDNLLECKMELNDPANERRPLTNSKWPPVNWKTATSVKSISSSGFTNLEVKSMRMAEMDVAGENQEQVVITQSELSSNFNIEDDQVILLDPENSEPHSNPSSSLVSTGVNAIIDSSDFSAPSIMNFSRRNSNGMDSLSGQNDILLTGRIGELTAFKYFSGQYVNSSVNWVNKTNETGLPYDIIIDDENSREYIEVKATKTTRKNWFFISIREWQFAIEKGESFSIAHVILSDNNMARVSVYRNPARLCELGNMKLAFVVPKN